MQLCFSVLLTQTAQVERWNLRTSSGLSVKIAPPLPSTATVVEWLKHTHSLGLRQIDHMSSVHGSNPPLIWLNAAVLSTCPNEWLRHKIQTFLLVLQLKRIAVNQSLAPRKSFNLRSHLKESFFIGRKSNGCEAGINFIHTHICFNLASICNIRVILNGSQITSLSLIASIFLSLDEVIPFIWQKSEWDGQPAKPLCVISTVCSADLICELSDC